MTDLSYTQAVVILARVAHFWIEENSGNLNLPMVEEAVRVVDVYNDQLEMELRRSRCKP